MVKRSIASIFIVLLVVCQIGFVMQETSFAATNKSGEDFIVRVGYWGDVKDYREKVKIPKSKMNSLPSQRNYYTNLTSVGTVMTTIAEGPTLKKILSEAKIDIGSVRLIHIRTTDSRGNDNNWFMEFPASQYLNNNLYYYPNLAKNWKRIDDGEGIPQQGALDGMKQVDTIIAVRSHSVKSASAAENLNPSQMTTEDSYRFCFGEIKLKELEETTQYSSHSSATKVFGIDITLWGSPGDATGLNLAIDDKNIMVGSTKRISATIKGQDLFEDKVDTKLKWRSSDKEIASVDKKGNVTIKKEGKVTITAKTSNGIKKSITINGKENEENAAGMGGDASGAGKGKGLSKGIKGGSLKAIEVNVGDKIVEDVQDERPSMDKEAIELPEEKTDPMIMTVAGCVAVMLFIIGVFISIRKYRKEV